MQMIYNNRVNCDLNRKKKKKKKNWEMFDK